MEAALEAGCATLITLERLRASTASDPHRTAGLTREINLIRRGIAVLRGVHCDAPDPLDYGFVLAEVDPDGEGWEVDDQEVPTR